MEGFVVVLALIAAVIFGAGVLFHNQTHLPMYLLSLINIPAVNIEELSRLVGQDVAHCPGGELYLSLAVGMAQVFSIIGGMYKLMSYWYQFAIMFGALFILTKIDAGTRVARYTRYIGTYVYKPLQKSSWWSGILATSAIVSAAWGILGL